MRCQVYAPTEATVIGLAWLDETSCGSRQLRHPDLKWTKTQGIYRGEVRSIMIALADITVDVKTILGYIEGDDGEEEAEDFPDP